MPYLEVVVQNGCAISANGISLAKGSGCLTFFFGSSYPQAVGYINTLEEEGWTLATVETNSRLVVFDGLPMGNAWKTLLFHGNGRYEIEWNNDRWHLKGGYISKYDNQDDDNINDYNDQDEFDGYGEEESDHWGPV